MLSVVLAFSLAGCYDDNLTWSAKMDDTTLPIGAYIYYLSTAYNEAAAKVDSESKVLDSQIDGVDAEEWILDRAELYVNQFFWMEQEMEHLGLEMTEADYEKATTTTNTYWSLYGGNTVFEEYGIAKSSFDLAYSQYNVKYLKIFEALYGEGGEMEVTEDELVAHYTDTYYNYEYYTVLMALPDAQGNPVEMTEEEAAALAENLEGIKKQIEDGDLTVEEAAEDYAAAYNQENTSYLTEVNNLSGLESSYMPTVFIETLTGMKENEVAVFEDSGYMAVLKRLPIDDTVEDMLSDESSRESVLIDLKSADYFEYAESAAAAMEGVELNTKAIARYQPKMFAEDTSAYGTSIAAEESSSEESSSEESTAE